MYFSNKHFLLLKQISSTAKFQRMFLTGIPMVTLLFSEGTSMVTHTFTRNLIKNSNTSIRKEAFNNCLKGT